MALRTVTNAGMQNVMVTETIQDESVEQGVRAAYHSRFRRTQASHVADAIAEWLRCQNLILVSCALLRSITICIGKTSPDSQNFHEAILAGLSPEFLC